MKRYAKPTVIVTALSAAYLLSPILSKLALQAQAKLARRHRLRMNRSKYVQFIRASKRKVDRLNAELINWADLNDDYPVSETITVTMLALSANTANVAYDWLKLKTPAIRGVHHLRNVLGDSDRYLAFITEVAMYRSGCSDLQLVDGANVTDKKTLASLNESVKTLREAVAAINQEL
ncbi:MAG: hypothetical protein ABI397_01140 [Candidatus Saccharimonas sp.]